MEVKENIITVDGPAGAGKSTISKIIAARLGCIYLDTGALYRGVALAAERQGLGPEDPSRLRELCGTIELRFSYDEDPPGLFLGQEDISSAIREPEIDLLSSKISAVREVREAMTRVQRKIAGDGVCLVAEGRDMGTVVFPDARFKFFLTASPEERAVRRYKERAHQGEGIPLSSVAEDLKRRDQQDESRDIAPLRPACDALIIDSTGLSIEEVVEQILSLIK